MKPRAGAGRVWEAAAQNERTSLSWTRSVLALLGAGLLVVRSAYPQLPVLGLALGVGVLTAAALVLLLSVRRYRRAAHRLHVSAALPDGVMPLAFCLATLSIGVLGGWAVLFSR